MSAPPAASATCSQCGRLRDPLLVGRACAGCLLSVAIDEPSDDGGGDAGDFLAAECRLGPYELMAPIGRGGMGVVYRALDIRLGRHVALKTLLHHIAFDAEARHALKREARILASLNHPHICTVHDVGTASGIDFIVMELVPGRTLAQLLEDGPLPAEQIVRYAVEIVDALAQAHRFGVTHRDVKPANIMVTASGAKLLDFGLATRWPDGGGDHERFVGTPRYMSPEQLAGGATDARSDLFAFGLTLQQMASGHPDMITALEPIISRCLVPAPAERWRSAQEVLVQLRAIARSRSDPGLVPAFSGRR
jgi:eukaryotic-like serine/threonine-protein kinase